MDLKVFILFAILIKDGLCSVSSTMLCISPCQSQTLSYWVSTEITSSYNSTINDISSKITDSLIPSSFYSSNQQIFSSNAIQSSFLDYSHYTTVGSDVFSSNNPITSSLPTFSSLAVTSCASSEINSISSKILHISPFSEQISPTDSFSNIFSTPSAYDSIGYLSPLFSSSTMLSICNKLISCTSYTYTTEVSLLINPTSSLMLESNPATSINMMTSFYYISSEYLVSSSSNANSSPTQITSMISESSFAINSISASYDISSMHSSDSIISTPALSTQAIASSEYSSNIEQSTISSVEFTSSFSTLVESALISPTYVGSTAGAISSDISLVLEVSSSMNLVPFSLSTIMSSNLESVMSSSIISSSISSYFSSFNIPPVSTEISSNFMEVSSFMTLNLVESSLNFLQYSSIDLFTLYNTINSDMSSMLSSDLNPIFTVSSDVSTMSAASSIDSLVITTDSSLSAVLGTSTNPPSSSYNLSDFQTSFSQLLSSNVQLSSNFILSQQESASSLVSDSSAMSTYLAISSMQSQVVSTSDLSAMINPFTSKIQPTTASDIYTPQSFSTVIASASKFSIQQQFLTSNIFATSTEVTEHSSNMYYSTIPTVGQSSSPMVSSSSHLYPGISSEDSHFTHFSSAHLSTPSLASIASSMQILYSTITHDSLSIWSVNSSDILSSKSNSYYQITTAITGKIIKMETLTSIPLSTANFTQTLLLPNIANLLINKTFAIGSINTTVVPLSSIDQTVSIVANLINSTKFMNMVSYSLNASHYNFLNSTRLSNTVMMTKFVISMMVNATISLNKTIKIIDIYSSNTIDPHSVAPLPSKAFPSSSISMAFKDNITGFTFLMENAIATPINTILGRSGTREEIHFISGNETSPMDPDSFAIIEYTRNGEWNAWPEIVSKSSPLILNTTEQFRVTSLSGYGFVIAEFTFANSDHLSVMYLGLAMPYAVKFNNTVGQAEINEDAKCEMYEYFYLGNIMHKAMDNAIYNEDWLNEESLPAINMSAFNRQIFTMQYEITSLDEKGKWYHLLMPSSEKIELTSGYKLANSSKICMEPSSDFTGNMTINFIVTWTDIDSGKYIDHASIIGNVVVKPSEDRPELNAAFVYAPYLPYNMSHVDDSGFTVQELMTTPLVEGGTEFIAHDVDGDTLGMIVVGAEATSIGEWQYKCNETAWKTINMTYVPFEPDTKTIYLMPNARLRYKLKEDRFWDVFTATSDASVTFHAWDMRDVKYQSTAAGVCAEKWMRLDETPEMASYSASVGKVVQLRKGCDGIAGTVAVTDACGVCGGDNSTCTGCDGVLNSNAVYDDCFNCTGGTTGVQFNANLDCLGTCGMAFIDECNICQVKIAYVNQADCNGVCSGGSWINQCGVCVGGSTGKSSDYSLDACGICGGDNSTCKDCASVPNGGKVVDLCDKCLAPSDENFNTECTSVGAFFPKVVCAKTATTVYIQASGLNTYSTVQCSVDNRLESVQVPTNFMENDVQKKISIQINPNINKTTTLNISCVLGSDSGRKAIGELLVIDETRIKLHSIQPEDQLINQAENLTIRGENFTDSAQLKCVYGMEKLHATFINETAVTCLLKPQPKSTSTDITLSFVVDNKIVIPPLVFKTIVESPYVVSAQFDVSLSFFTVVFDKPSELGNNSIGCQHLFPADHSKLGASSECFFISLYVLKVSLVGGSTLAPGNVVFNFHAIKCYDAEHTYYKQQTATVDIAAPANPAALQISIVGTRQLAICDEANLAVRTVNGDGGRKLTYSWSATWSTNNFTPQQAQTDALAQLNAKLSQLNEPRFSGAKDTNFQDTSIKFSVTATNFLGVSSQVEIVVERENKNIPSLQLSRTELTKKASQDIFLQAITKLSECIPRDSFTAKMTYQWQLEPSVGITLPAANLPKLIIPAGMLKGGQTYTATVVVAMQQNPQLSAMQSATIAIESSPLVAVIKGPQTIGSNAILTLDGGDSFDPDHSDAQVSYKWYVKREDNSAVINNGKSLLLPSLGEINVNVLSNLTSGHNYVFRLVYRVGDRVAEDTKVVNVVKGDPPEIIARPVSDNVSPSSKLTLSATISSATPGSYEWSCELVHSSDKTFGTLNLTTQDVVLTSTSGSFNDITTATLVLKGGVLQSNVRYRLKLTAHNADESAHATLDFKTNGVPVKGMVSVSPLHGTALNTSFTITATEGWTDPDGHELFFVFGYRTPEDDLVLFAPQSDPLYKTQLSPGVLTILVYCYDSYGAFSLNEQHVVNVTKATISDAQLFTFEQEMQDAADSGDVSTLLGISSTIMLSMNMEEPSPALISFQQKTVDLVLNANGILQDEASKRQAVNGLGALTGGAAENFETQLKLKIVANMLAILGVTLPSSSSKRKRRSKSPAEIEQDLLVFNNILQPLVYTQSSLDSKKSFLTSLDALTQSMCASIGMGEVQAMAKRDNLVVMTTSKLDFNADAAQGYLRFGSDTTQHYVMLSNSSLATYDSYTCGNKDTCTGACISSAHMDHDLLSTSLDPNILSSVYMLNLWNAMTSSQLINDVIPGGILLKIVAKKTAAHSYLCKRWNGASWDTPYITTHNPLGEKKNNESHVTCNITRIGYVALFQGPNLITPSSSPIAPVVTQSAKTTPNPVNPSDFSRHIRFSFDGNCSEHFTDDASQQTFAGQFKSEIAAKVNVSVASMASFNVTCGSIIVTYVQTSHGNVTAKQASDAVKILVTTGNFTVTIGGKTLLADKDSFAVVIIGVTITATVTPTSALDDGVKLTTGAIVGIVVGCLALLIIVAAVLYYCVFKKDARRKILVAPCAEDTEMIKSNCLSEEQSVC